MKLQKLTALCLCTALSLSLSACSGGGSASTPAGSGSSSGEGSTPADPITLVFSTTALPNSPHGEAQEVFKTKLEELSGGTMTVENYYNGTLFAQNAETAALRAGDCDMIYSGAAWLTDGSPWVSMFSSGYFFKNYDHMTAVLNGEIGQEVFQRIADEQGILPLCAYYMGSRDISLTEDRPVTTPDDLKGVNLRMPDSDAWMFLGRALGANPTPVNFSDLYLALQTGTVDGQDNPLAGVESAKFYEVQSSITITNHDISSVWPTINLEKWNSLTQEQHGWVREALEAGREYCDQKYIDSESSLIDFFKEQGLSIYYADIDTFAKHVQNEYLNSDFSSTWDMDLYQKVQDMAA